MPSCSGVVKGIKLRACWWVNCGLFGGGASELQCRECWNQHAMWAEYARALESPSSLLSHSTDARRRGTAEQVPRDTIDDSLCSDLLHAVVCGMVIVAAIFGAHWLVGAMPSPLNFTPAD